MTDKKEMKKYCLGIDCLTCDEAEPCIYRIANKLQEQLKRKEQEYEELRQYHNKCCEEFKNEKQNLIDKYNQFSKDFFIGKYCKKESCDLLKAKEQECEELKQWKKSAENLFKAQIDNPDEIINQYKQAIDMIKEYCKLYESKLNITIPIIKHIIDKVIEN